MEAQRDQNYVTTLLAVSSVDGVTPVTLYADPVTHRLLVNLASGDGTVTDVSVVTANGFAGTVATSTTTPAITLSTTVTGILKGDGTAISAATAGTDYTALAFKTISVSGQSDIVADSAADTLTIAAGTGITITTNAGTDTLTIAMTTDPAAYATKALDNLAAVAINTALLPGTSDSIALGSGTKNWSDLFLGDAAVINFNNGNYTITHAAGVLAFSGNIKPLANDGGALGVSGTAWADLFLASGAVIDFAAANVVLTHTSGVLTMGTGTLKITTPTNTATSVVTIDGTQTFTNKTMTSSTNILGGVTMTLGSDADGDMYYRASNVLTRLGKGTGLQILRMNSGATAPEWADNAATKYAYTAQSGTYPITTTDTMIDCTSGTFTTTLPTAVGVTGKFYIIKNSGTGVITIATTSSQTIDAATTLLLTQQWSSVTVVSDGANWKII